MASGMVPHVISALTPDPEFGYGPAIECTWCLHYLVSRCGLFSFHKNLLNNDRIMESCAKTCLVPVPPDGMTSLSISIWNKKRLVSKTSAGL